MIDKKNLACFFALTLAIFWGIPDLGIFRPIWIPEFPFSFGMYTPFYYAGVWGPVFTAFMPIAHHKTKIVIRKITSSFMIFRINILHLKF